MTVKESPPRTVAQQQVDEAREWVDDLTQRDSRLNALVERHGLVWEYVGDDGSATWLIARVGEDGVLEWPEP